MQFRFTRAATLALAGIVAGGGLAAPAMADSIPFTAVSVTTITPAGTTPNKVTHAQDGATPPGASATQSSSSGAWGDATASGTADLASGQLGGRSSVTFDDGTPYVYSQFFSWMGDGFRSYDDNGDPFDWDGQTATFSLDVHGDIFAPANVSGYTAWVALVLYEPGTVHQDSKFFNDEHEIAHYLFHVGRSDQQVFYTDGVNNFEVFPTAYLGDLSSTVHINQTIAPGGDFDWVVVMASTTFLTNPGTLDVDLSNTVTLGFTGPAGATTRSVSGAFTNITNQQASVPEPATFAMLGWGVCALVARRRLTKA